MSVFNSKRFFFYDSKNREKAKNISFPQKKFLFNVLKKREEAKNISFPQYFFLPDPKEMEQKEMTKSHFLLSPDLYVPLEFVLEIEISSKNIVLSFSTGLYKILQIV